MPNEPVTDDLRAVKLSGAPHVEGGGTSWDSEKQQTADDKPQGSTPAKSGAARSAGETSGVTPSTSIAAPAASNTASAPPTFSAGDDLRAVATQEIASDKFMIGQRVRMTDAGVKHFGNCRYGLASPRVGVVVGFRARRGKGGAGFDSNWREQVKVLRDGEVTPKSWHMRFWESDYGD